MTIPDERLIAFADGELAPDERAKVEAELAANPTIAARAAAHMRLREQVEAAFTDVLNETLPERLQRAAAGGWGSNIVPLRARAAQLMARRWWPSGVAAAASLVLGLFAGRALSPASNVGMIGTDMAAQGALARALSNQLVATQGDSAVRILFSFRANDRLVCRAFEIGRSHGVAGLACRRPDKAWQVRIAAPMGSGGEGGEYRTSASSLPAPVAELAQSLVAGRPFDAPAEARAKAAGWN